MPARKRSSKKTTTIVVKQSRRPRRRTNTVSGRGFYKGFGRDVGSYLGHGAGMLATRLTGVQGLSSIGSKLGGYLGQKGSELTGWGAYKINRNSIVGIVPKIWNPNREGATTIRHKEYLGEVYATSDYTVQYAIDINPALPNFLPWASQLCGNFQQYQLDGMLFEYVPTSGNAVSSTNSALGTVMLATNYDSIQPLFNDKSQMLNTEFSASTKPSKALIHPIECDRSQSSISILYTRNTAPPTNSDQRMYDFGKFQLATEGQQIPTTGKYVIGELWCSYDISCFKPILSNTEQDYYHAQIVNASGQNPFGPNTTTFNTFMGLENCIKPLVNNVGNTDLYVQDGDTSPIFGSINFGPLCSNKRYMITYFLGVHSATANVIAFAPSLTGSINALKIFRTNTDFYVENGDGNGLVVSIAVETGDISPMGPPAVVNVTNINFQSAIFDKADLIIAELPRNLDL